MPNNSSFTNHLSQEKSPYLLQHARNPVDWYPWGVEAFKKAKAENKPILLSIGYSTCHWCHVMAHESFENETIAQLINEHFVAIKVDREERPDIDHIYMMAVTAMSGHGGWPLTAFLTPDADPFYGGTYFPPYAKWGSVGFIDLLNSIAQGWQKERENILSSGRSITESLRTSTSRRAGVEGEMMDQTVVDQAARQLRGQFDAVNGGFGSAPKFPMGHNLSFLLRYYKITKSPEILKMVEASLLSMAQGGIWDHLGGGFHRYSTDAQWHVPHFEKMLYDQALLSQAYLEAYQLTGERVYAQIAEDILDYVLRDMTHVQGGFYSAEDADSLTEQRGHLAEGAFYVFTEPEIQKVLGATDAEIFNYCYGVKPQGNAGADPHGEFINKNILYLAHSIAEAGEKFQRHDDEIKSILRESRKKLLDFRQERPYPHKDDKILCDWNGLMISSLAMASRVLGQSRYAKAAVHAAGFIWSHLHHAKGLLHRWREDEAAIEATLEDYAFFINALLDLYEATFESMYLEQAQILSNEMLARFADEAGAFYMTSVDAKGLILRPKEIYDGAIPSGNSVAALGLLKLYVLTKRQEYLSSVESLFRFFSTTVAQAPYAHTYLLSAFQWYLKGAAEITFEGLSDDEVIAKMLKVLYKHFVPFKTVQFKLAQGLSSVYLCQRGACQAPTNSVEDFARELNQL